MGTVQGSPMPAHEKKGQKTRGSLNSRLLTLIRLLSSLKSHQVTLSHNKERERERERECEGRKEGDRQPVN
jgi:hypothetical protein